MEAIIKLKSSDPPQFLSPNEDLSVASRKASEYLFTFLKPYSPKSPFDKLLTNGFDAEQIWLQIDIQSQPLISSLNRDVNRFQQNPLQNSSLFKGNEKIGLENGDFEEDGDVGLEEDGEDFEDEDENEDGVESGSGDESGDEEEEEDEEEEVEDDGDGVPEVEDEFLRMKDLEKFLVKEEKKEYEDYLNKKNKKKNTRGNDEDDDDESLSDDDLENGGLNELLMYGGGNDNDEDNSKEIRYEDLYLPNKKMPKRRVKQVDKSDDSEMENEKNFMPKRRPEQVNESDQSDEPESDGDEPQRNKNLSTHERERKKLQAKIKQMEEANLAAKDWTMQGEVTASKRPRDSALEVDLDFEHNLRPPPVITEEVTTSLEDIIKKRISEGRFDDVRRAPKLPSAAPKERKELDDNKSKKGLAEIYEEEYAQQTGLASAPLSHNDELRKEASELFKRLRLKLDALSHFHFAPKPVMEDMTIPTNVPALAMEEIAPVAVSDAAMLAPEEVFAGKGDIKEDAELTKEDRKRKRATKKRKFKAINAAKTANRTADKTLQSNVEGKEV